MFLLFSYITALFVLAHPLPLFANTPTAATPAPTRVVFGVLRPPYIFEKQNKGLDFEIAASVFKIMKIKIVATHSTNSRGWSEIEQNKADALVGVTPDEGSKSLFYSEPMIKYDNVAISKKKRKITIQKISDLKKVRFVSFSEAHRYLGPEFEAIVRNAKRSTDIADQRKQNFLFWSDKIDVIILDLNVFRFYMRELSTELETSDPVVIHRIFSMKSSWRSVAFRDKSLRDQFNVALAALKSDGRYQAILDKYLKVDAIEPVDSLPSAKSL